MPEATMPEALEPNIGRDLRLMHSLISRALRVSIDECRRGDDRGKRVGAPGLGFVSYVRTLVAVLEGHFAAEEELLWPHFAPVLPDAPFLELHGQHDQMRALLAGLRGIADTVSNDGDMGEVKTRLFRPLALLEGTWGPHIQPEEEYLSIERVAGLESPDTQARLSAALYQFMWKRVDPEYLALPFMLFNLSPAARLVFSSRLPAIITEDLVPVRWKEHWQPMKPFLLE
jgi:hypothetical protein